MLYEKNNTKFLEDELFQNPTSEYRGAPFWAWNCELELEELERQLSVLKQMGFGGAHLHVRTGMATPYLSDEYMALIKACVQKAKNEEMLAWLYDEDCWPSGSAGGLVTKDKRYRERRLIFTPFDDVKAEDKKLLACYDIELDAAGYLKTWEMIDPSEAARFEKWYAFLTLREEEAWYNNQAYVNTLDKAAMDKFIDITYESYNRTVSEEFGKTVPAIFTDEPQFALKSTLKFSKEKAEVILPWTDDLVESFAEAYEGEDLLKGIPELIWDRADGKPSRLRYRYHDHVCHRFVTAFVDNCGAWCQSHGLMLTGHMMEEPTLESQTKALGEAMRAYRSFDLPGIDMLCARLEYTTAKQTQSAVHQFGREGMMSELYGVTNWDFDFRGFKLHGDWQAALGVTVRVPHLAWVSMAGEAKRDYPASISYQSPWWEKFHLIEDHFARVNTALTRGKALVKIGVIHPIESYWLHWGPSEQTALWRDKLEQNFENITEWLLFGGMDFDFICESLLPELQRETDEGMYVGEMKYDVILVPECETLRTTTLDFLEAYASKAGKVIFLGDIAVLEDAAPSERANPLARNCRRIPFNRSIILEELQSERLVEIRNQTGAMTDDLLHQIRQDGDGRWLFIAHGKEPYNKDVSNYQDLRIRVAGNWKAMIYHSEDGRKERITANIQEGETEIFHRLYDYDSLLLRLEPIANEEMGQVIVCDNQSEVSTEKNRVVLPDTMEYTLSEPNVLLLDRASYALDEEEWQPEEEILRLDEICREKLHWQSRKLAVVQPWAIEEEAVTHVVHLRWQIHSEIEAEGVQLAIEDAESAELMLDGKPVPNDVIGWYVDKAIKTVALPKITKGIHVLEAAIPFGKRTNVEWVYLLGNFGVQLFGKKAVMIPMRKEISFGSITNQGFPFYGGNITYHVPIHTGDGNLQLRSSQYRGSLQTVSVDEGKENPVIYPPYTVSLGTVNEGRHMLHLTLYGNRQNAFGPVHLTDLKERWISPEAWRSEGEKWCYEYMTKELGILTAPEVVQEKQERN